MKKRIQKIANQMKAVTLKPAKRKMMNPIHFKLNLFKMKMSLKKLMKNQNNLKMTLKILMKALKQKTW